MNYVFVTNKMFISSYVACSFEIANCLDLKPIHADNIIRSSRCRVPL